MRVAIYDRVEPPMPVSLPLRLTQDCSQRSASVLLAVVVPAALAATAGAVGILSALLAPEARALLQQRPTLGLEIVAGIAFLIYLLAIPSRRLIGRLTTSRVVEIDHGMVTVAEDSHFRAWTWSAPLASYSGITHHVRASLSGTRHELILVHPMREKSILLSVAPRTSQVEVDRVTALLGQKQVPPSELYRFKGLWPRTTTQPLPEASHA